MRTAKEARIGLCSLLLLVVSTTGLVSAAMSSGNLPGFERFQAGIYWQSPTKTYQGYFSMAYRGIYRHVTETPLCRQAFPQCLYEDQSIFYLETDSGYLVRLIFYCGLDYCTQTGQISLNEGGRVYVKGTLIEPSQWQGSLSKPNLYFIGDLYVFQSSNLND
jgi:hypothetical protein